MKLLKAIGLMSGTSMDGIDAALLTSNGRSLLSRGGTFFYPFRREERTLLAAAHAQAKSLSNRSSRPPALREAEQMVTEAHAQAVLGLLEENRLRASEIDLIGFHGQTLLHKPEAGLTIQIGDGPRLADLTGIDVIYDFRQNDVASGGEGAPLVPVYHQALVETLGLEMPVAVVNIGGVANVTWINGQEKENEDRPLVAFDTGPGNGLIDDWVQAQCGITMDRDGALAMKGRVHREIVDQYLCHPFFKRPPPKSLDRMSFSLDPLRGLSPEDGAATLASVTACTIAGSVIHMKAAPKKWIISGGGTHNPVIMKALKAALNGASLSPAQSVGWSPDSLEAEAFAYLAIRSVKGLPISFPATTGTPRPMTGGRLATKID